MGRPGAYGVYQPKPLAWEPAEGFVEIDAGVWVPRGYVRGPWELPTPVVRTKADAVAEYARCAKSLPHFAFHHCFSVHVDDPSGPSWRKIPAYPYLRRFFTSVQTPTNTHVEKSRQLLMSWAWMVVFLWDVLFQDQWSDLVISRRAKEVDDGGDHSTIDSLLGKLRHVWLTLPPYLQQPLVFQMFSVRHPEARSYVRGETGTAKAGRGSAHKRALLDEAAYLEKSESIFKAVRNVAKSGTILNSTPNGKNNTFARIRFDPDTTFAKLTFHWSEHPDKSADLYCTCGWKYEPEVPGLPAAQYKGHRCGNLSRAKPTPPECHSPWYDRECLDLTPESVASELDLSYERSRRGRVYPTFDVTRHVFEHQQLRKRDGSRLGERHIKESMDAYRRRYLETVLQPELATIVTWDFGVLDPTALLLGQVVDEPHMRIRWIDEFQANNQSWDFFYTFIQGLWAPVVEECTVFSLLHYGDPSGKGRWGDLSSWVSNLAARDPAIRIITSPRLGSVLEWIDLISQCITRGDFEVSSWCAGLIDVLGQYHYPTDERGDPIPGNQKPVHDQTSHWADSLRYGYMFRWPYRLKNVDEAGVTFAEMMDVVHEYDE